MFNWFGRKSGGMRERRAVAELAPAAEPASLAVPADPNDAFVEWLFRQAPDPGRPMGRDEQEALRQIDELIAAGGIPPSLMARPPIGASTVLGMLRDDELPTGVLASHIAKDLALTAEVLRLSRSARYARRASPATADLPQSIAALGRSGVQQAVVRVLVQPMFSASGGSLSGRVAERLWQHTELKALSCEALAIERGLPVFEAYVAGLAHNTGWALAWRVADRVAAAWADPFSLDFTRAVASRQERLFGKLMLAWQITPALSGLGAELLRDGPAGAASPMARMLAQADALATARVSTCPATGSSDPRC